MSTLRYAKDKPESCKRCSFWKGDRVDCSLGTANCYYLLEGRQPVPEECVNCPYIRDGACVGSCYKRLLPHIWGGAVHAAG